MDDVVGGTSEAAREASRRLGLDPGITEKQISNLLRRAPNLRPRLVAGRRVWTQADVDGLVRLLLTSRLVDQEEHA